MAHHTINLPWSVLPKVTFDLQPLPCPPFVLASVPGQADFLKVPLSTLSDEAIMQLTDRLREDMIRARNEHRATPEGSGLRSSGEWPGP